jgi:hypothetical protein
MLTRVSLVAGDREMLLRPRDGIGAVNLDFGFPTIRAVEEERTDDDGVDDSTEFFGASAVSLTLSLYRPGTTRMLIDELRSYCHPALRPYLVVTDDEWTQPRRIRLRIDQQSTPIERGRGYLREVQVGWKAPDGAWEAVEEVQEAVNADVTGTGVGLQFPVTFPISFAATQSTGAALLFNLGNIPSHLVARLYGPCTAPKLINVTTGQQIAFKSSLVLGPGEYVEVNTRDQSAYLLSNPALSRLDDVDFLASSWWRMQPGQQQVRYAPEAVSGGAEALIFYRPAWL